MNEPLRKTMCATCPFRPGSKYAFLAADLAQSATTEASRFCHSTGNNALGGKTGLPEYICRGARNVQLDFMKSCGVIKAATDEAWNEARKRIGLPVTMAQDPPKRKAARR